MTNQRGLLWALDLARDVRYAGRSLRRAPGFATVAIVTLALGIGANTAMFSVLNTFLFRTLPYPRSDRLVRVMRTSIYSQTWPHSAANFLDQRARNSVFEYMAAFTGARQSLTQSGDAAEALQGLAVSADFFPALGVQAAIGRTFTPEEDQPGANRVAVLSHRFWQRRFGGDPTILDRTITLEGEDVKVIGVMPPEFEHPLLWGTIDLWRPIAFTPEQRQNRGSNYLNALARLKPGVSIGRAQDAIVTLAATLSKETKSNQDESLRLEPMQVMLSNDPRRMVLWFTWGLAGFVLLIACANLANLQLARTAAHARDQTIRAALGAGRLRLLRQTLTESLLVSVLGGALSVLLARAIIVFISRRLFSDLPGVTVTTDLAVFGFALVCSVITGLIFGTVPAWLASNTDVNQALKDAPRGSTVSSHHRLRHSLIVGQVAFAVVLLTGAGLFLRGLQRFGDRDPGWRVDGLLTAQLGLRGPNLTTPEQRVAFYDQLERRLRALPGVTAVGLSNSLPAAGFNSSGGIAVEGLPEPEPGHYPEAFLEPVNLGYFDALGARLMAGRLFTASDTADRPMVIVINETMAQRFWPDQSAIGKRIKRPGGQIWFEVVGIVNDISFPATLAEPYTRLQIFRPMAQAPTGAVNLTLRTSTAPEALADPVRRAVAELIPASPVARIRTARTIVDQGLGGVSLLGTLLGAFALLGLILAAVGIYGVTSYSIAQRTSEFGIRLALGAQARDVLWLVLSTGARLIASGATLGVAGAYAVSRLLVATIPTLPTRDPFALGAITLALVAVALVACYVPAGRAARMDPIAALRHD